MRSELVATPVGPTYLLEHSPIRVASRQGVSQLLLWLDIILLNSTLLGLIYYLCLAFITDESYKILSPVSPNTKSPSYHLEYWAAESAGKAKELKI